MGSVVRPCRYCDETIEMSDREGKYLPYNENGSRHYCRKKEEKRGVKEVGTWPR